MRTKSIWGNPPSRLYRFREILREKFGNSAKICIVGASDGKFVLPFLRAGLEVTAYELDEVAAFGGEKSFPLERVFVQRLEYIPNPYRNPKYQNVPAEKREILGLKRRVAMEGLEHLLTIRMENFYRNPPSETYAGVFTSCSIPYPCNFDIPVPNIISALKNSVSAGGYLYMDYMMPLEDHHNWRPKHYLRRGEMKKFFEDDDWKIIHVHEMSKPVFEVAHVDRPEDHFHRFGYILAEHRATTQNP